MSYQQKCCIPYQDRYVAQLRKRKFSFEDEEISLSNSFNSSHRSKSKSCQDQCPSKIYEIESQFESKEKNCKKKLLKLQKPYHQIRQKIPIEKESLIPFNKIRQKTPKELQQLIPFNKVRNRPRNKCLSLQSEKWDKLDEFLYEQKQLKIEKILQKKLDKNQKTFKTLGILSWILKKEHFTNILLQVENQNIYKVLTISSLMLLLQLGIFKNSKQYGKTILKYALIIGTLFGISASVILFIVKQRLKDQIREKEKKEKRDLGCETQQEETSDHEQDDISLQTDYQIVESDINMENLSDINPNQG